MGREANVTGLGLEGLGIEFTGKGIQVDNRLRTKQKHIYAAEMSPANIIHPRCRYEEALFSPMLFFISPER